MSTFNNYGSGATVTFSATSGVITSITASPAAGGHGYPVSSTFFIRVTGGGGSGAILLATTDSSGVITGFVTLPAVGGTGYTSTTGAATGSICVATTFSPGDGSVQTGPLTATSTASVTPVPGSVMDLSQTDSGSLTWQITETGGVHSVTVTIDNSNDGVHWNLAAATVTISASATGTLNASNLGRFARISIVDGSGGSHGTISAIGYAQ